MHIAPAKMFFMKLLFWCYSKCFI